MYVNLLDGNEPIVLFKKACQVIQRFEANDRSFFIVDKGSCLDLLSGSYFVLFGNRTVRLFISEMQRRLLRR